MQNLLIIGHLILSVIAGAYNMGGSPAPTVAKIKNMVYMNHTREGETDVQPREEYLGKYIFNLFWGEHSRIATIRTIYVIKQVSFITLYLVLFQTFIFLALEQRSMIQT